MNARGRELSPRPALAADFDVARVRADFPILKQQVNGKPLVYLDNAASSQKPERVLAAMDRFYREDYANVHRGVHALSERATTAFEQARVKAQKFLNARSEREIVFVRGTTEAVNLVAASYGRAQVGAGDEVLISAMEHHSNIVPWQMLCEEKGAKLRVAPINDRGELLLEELERLLTARTRLVSLAHVSNALGTINPVREVVALAHARGIPVMIDGAQAAPHLKIDVQAIGCDFYAFSSHKVFGPSGIGVLYGRAERLEAMPPYQGGGDMILSVSFEKTIYNRIPHKFEAGTPDIAGVVGLGAALEYVNQVDLDRAGAHEQELLAYATAALSEIPGITLIGRAGAKASVLSFVLGGVHPHDIATVLDQEGVAIRAGHHCAQPVMERFGVPATARASLALYNTREEIDVLLRAVRKVKEIFG
jgi:cysteine desulfurase/selenocysteine lyase